MLDMPKEAKFINAGAGSVQRFDLENGDILLPIYFKAEKDKYYRVTVLRCSFRRQHTEATSNKAMIWASNPGAACMSRR
jgi:hypothetical protein